MSNTDDTSDNNIESSTTNVWNDSSSVLSWNYPNNNETSWNNSNFNSLILAIDSNNLNQNNQLLNNTITNNVIIPYPNTYFSQNFEDRIVNSIINESFYDKNPIKNVISEEGKESIKFIKWNQENPLKNCPIFLNEFKEDDEIAILPCNHCFSKEAVMYWLTNENNSCPTCRFPLKSVEKKTQECQYQSSPVQTFRNTPEAPSVFDFILNRLEDHLEQRQLEQIILQSLITSNNENNYNVPESEELPDNYISEEEEEQEELNENNEITMI